MNLKETKTILAMIRSTYHITASNGLTAEDVDTEARIWQQLFPEPFEMVMPAVKICMQTMHFAPLPADIREQMAIALEDQEDTPERAWEIYRKAFCQLGSYESAREAWEQLPEKIRAVTSPAEMKTFAYDLTSAEVNGFQKTQFVKAYEGLKKARREQLKGLPMNKPENVALVAEPAKIAIEGKSA